MRILALSLLALTMGCVSAAAIDQARKEVGIQRGHANDATLPPEARMIGLVGEESWSAQLYNLDGTKLSEAVYERMKALGKVPEGYEQ